MKTRACLVFAPLGPNPAPLVELIWKLAQERFQRITPHVVVGQRARHYLDQEVLAPGTALDQVRDAVGAGIVADPVIYEARDGTGALIEDDVEPEARDHYVHAVWAAARAVAEQAGDRPVVFGLVAGRRRTMTALQTSMFQLLARPGDLLLDVRVSDPRVEGGTGFFFPEQPRRRVLAKGSTDLVDASSVDVVLVELRLPLLRPFVPSAALASFEDAQAASRATLAAVAPPHLVIDLSSRTATADGVSLGLTPSQLLWYGYLCDARRRGEPEIWVKDYARLRAFLRRLSAVKNWNKMREESPYRKILHGEDDEAEVENALGKYRSEVGSRLSKLKRTQRPAFEQIVPRSKRRKYQGALANFVHIPLRSEFIEVRGLELAPLASGRAAVP